MSADDLLFAGERLVPTLRMVPGSSSESLALAVAADCRLPPQVLARAAELYHTLSPSSMQREAGRGVPAAETATGGREQVAGTSGAVAPAGAGAATEGEQQQQQLREEGSRSPPIEAAAGVLAATAQQILADLHQQQPHQQEQQQQQHSSARPSGQLGTRQGSLEESPSCGDGSSAGSAQPSLQEVAQVTVAAYAPAAAALEPRLVAPGWSPPPSVDGASCVYVLRSEQGWYYCGSSDSLRQRLQQHRRPAGKGGPQVGRQGMQMRGELGVLCLCSHQQSTGGVVLVALEGCMCCACSSH